MPGYTLIGSVTADPTAFSECDPGTLAITDGIVADEMAMEVDSCGYLSSPCGLVLVRMSKDHGNYV